jgi:CxxC motif-containing protein (DUF1111 family)
MVHVMTQKISLIALVSLTLSVQSTFAQDILVDTNTIIPRTEAEKARVAKITQPTVSFTAPEKFETNPAGSASVRVRSNADAFSSPSENISFANELDFKLGNALFRKLWVSSPSSTLASDGLGPLFNARSCQRCHLKDGRGHPPAGPNDANVSMVMGLVRPALDTDYSDIKDYIGSLPDPVYGKQLQDFSVAGVDAEGKFTVTYEDMPITLADGTIINLQKPTYDLTSLTYGPMHIDTVATPRVAPQMIGLGLLEAIPAQDILSLADPNDLDGNGVSGRANIVHSKLWNGPALGRFGYKAQSANVLEQSANAFANDIGISTTFNPSGAGDCTTLQIKCQDAPDGSTDVHDGVEISDEAMGLVNFYARNLGVPRRRNLDDVGTLRGKEIFYSVGCTDCHRPKFVTNRLKDQPEQSFQLIWPYTDLLLHDMGEELADHTNASRANGYEWKTPPLWGIGLTEQVSGHTRFLHDGRARNLLEAILWHGGEAEAARNNVISLSQEDRDALIQFIESL